MTLLTCPAKFYSDIQIEPDHLCKKPYVNATQELSLQQLITSLENNVILVT